MTQEIKTFNNLDEAINNYQIKVECEIEPKRWWIFVSYKGRTYYAQSQYDPRESEIAKEAMIKNIRNEAEIVDRDENFKITC